jgi:hypothetical protein
MKRKLQRPGAFAALLAFLAVAPLRRTEKDYPPYFVQVPAIGNSRTNAL